MEREIEEMHKTVEVGGYRYLISHPDPESAIKIGLQLMGMIAESVATLTKLKDKSADDSAVLSKALAQLLVKADPDTTANLMKKMLRLSVEVQGKIGGENKKMLLDDTGFKIHFHGKTGAIVKVLAEVIDFTQKDFFNAVMDGIAGIMK